MLAIHETVQDESDRPLFATRVLLYERLDRSDLYDQASISLEDPVQGSDGIGAGKACQASRSDRSEASISGCLPRATISPM